MQFVFNLIVILLMLQIFHNVSQLNNSISINGIIIIRTVQEFRRKLHLKRTDILQLQCCFFSLMDLSLLFQLFVKLLFLLSLFSQDSIISLSTLFW